MTVSELIAKLQTMPGDLPIRLYQYECECRPASDSEIDDIAVVGQKYRFVQIS